jgi:acyl CoA:acetate/3-ketoacid CoA transferase alpha subunit
MTWRITSPVIGYQRIDETSTTKKHPLGTIVQAHDATTYETGEFIYLKGIGSTVVGSWVTYNVTPGTTALIAPSAIGPVAIAMSANVASQYGWYQISGHAIAKAADVADSGKVYIDTTAGFCDDAAVVGDRVNNAKWTGADDTSGYATVYISRPFVTDQKDAT